MDRTLLSGIVFLFVFAAIMVPITMTGQVIEDQENNQEPQALCLEEWTCDDWTECSDDKQSRTCTDQNDCGTDINKPAEIQDCEAPKEWVHVARFAGDESEEGKRSRFTVDGDRFRVVWNCLDITGYNNIGKGFAAVSNESVVSAKGRCEYDAQEEMVVEGNGESYVTVQAINLNFWSVEIEEQY